MNQDLEHMKSEDSPKVTRREEPPTVTRGETVNSSHSPTSPNTKRRRELLKMPLVINSTSYNKSPAVAAVESPQ